MKTGRKPTSAHRAQFNAAALKRAMKAAKVTQMDLREALKANGVVTGVHQITSGKRAPSFPTAALIARLLNVPLDDLCRTSGKITTIEQVRKKRRPPGRPPKTAK